MKSRALVLLVLLSSLAQVAPARADGEASPLQCAQCSKPVRVAMPMLRTAVVYGGMYAGMVAIWPEAYAPSQSSAAQFRESWTNPPYANFNKVFFELDDDSWVVNGVGHALFGSEAYLAARDWGHPPWLAFIYGVGATLVWEYLIEAWFQRPSGIDLVWTPFAGAALGELRFQLLLMAAKGIRKKGPRVLVMSLLDPLGQLERLMLGCTL